MLDGGSLVLPSDVAAVGISVTDRDNVAIADEMRALQKKGVKVIAIDSDLDSSLHDAPRCVCRQQ